jgi:hypothetical protein
MPRIRWINYQGKDWRLSDLARSFGLRPQTLAARLDRGYELERALVPELCDKTEAGRRGSETWRSCNSALFED